METQENVVENNGTTATVNHVGKVKRVRREGIPRTKAFEIFQKVKSNKGTLEDFTKELLVASKINPESLSREKFLQEKTKSSNRLTQFRKYFIAKGKDVEIVNKAISLEQGSRHRMDEGALDAMFQEMESAVSST